MNIRSSIERIDIINGFLFPSQRLRSTGTQGPSLTPAPPSADDWDPWILWRLNQPPTSATGVMRTVMDIMAEKLGFCYKEALPIGLDFGARLENGSFSGLIGELNRGEADMSMVPMSINHIRNEAVDFSETLFVDEHRITFKRPFPEADIAGFVKPFTPTDASSPLREKTGDDGTGPTRDGTPESSGKSVTSKLRYAVLWTLSCLFSQSVPWEPRKAPVRVVAGIWLLASLIVGSVYRSNLKAMLILPKVVIPFETFEEFAKVDIRGYIILGGILDVALRGMEANSTLGRIRDKSRIDANIGRGLSELIEGKTAPIASTSGQRWVYHFDFTNEGYCRMYSTRDGVFSTAAALGFPKGSPLKPKIDSMIRGLKEFGILQHLFQKEVPNSTFCFRKPVSISPTSADLRPLELGDFYGVFCLYAGGILLAMLVFVMERIVERNGQRMTTVK
ncbi:glutamate receptor ionotropic, delta-1-like [Penaeus chinensis]|uniref:glutamate receptor ionotropic, delta-1-like n=1 Tax=Penaeus chinensis TaxID=139456 RepID=UPI001FB664E9|nr:glutamate receptor ionotropic, delta-1-like [Penaeus chinensis]